MDQDAQQYVQQQLQGMKSEIIAMENKLTELDVDRREHDLVIGTISKLEPERKCFRLIGGVLAERTVKELLPTLEANKKNIELLMENLIQQLEAKQKESNEFQAKHKITQSGKSAKDQVVSSNEKSSSYGSGVLV